MTYATRPRSSARRGDRYKEMEVLSATPGALVVMVYDHLITSLLRARAAIVAGDAEARMEEVGRARDAVGELLATLDVERGGAVAGQLGGLYTFFLRELTFVGTEPAVGRIDRVVAMVRDLREAFVGIQTGVDR
ncbi:MAG: flagellar export chaperone FliS [Gemmatimonadetes bacterium]|nr:flagellar export chaperone FliS [Gemmatimonadota bacterium]